MVIVVDKRKFFTRIPDTRDEVPQEVEIIEDDHEFDGINQETGDEGVVQEEDVQQVND